MKEHNIIVSRTNTKKYIYLYLSVSLYTHLMSK